MAINEKEKQDLLHDAQMARDLAECVLEAVEEEDWEGAEDAADEARSYLNRLIQNLPSD